MAKLSKHFDFILPILWDSKKKHLQVRISGVGYCYSNCPVEDKYSFDIEQVWANNQEFTEAFTMLAFAQDSSLVDQINAATEQHMHILFDNNISLREPDSDLDLYIEFPTVKKLNEALDNLQKDAA